MASIDKSKFQFVKRDDFASETIDAPAYSYWKSVMRQFFKKKSTTVMLGILIAIILIALSTQCFQNLTLMTCLRLMTLVYVMCIQMLNTGSVRTVW